MEPRPRWRIWFHRLAAAQFILTAATGLCLYFRPLADREGAYGESAKEWLVMLHNGEWLSQLALGSRYVSGLAVGAVLAALVVRFAWRALRRQG
mgnify:CR=1 FL=1